jgi:hypothetical protein
MLLLAFVAFWDNALEAGYLTNPYGYLFLLLAVVIWFKWAAIRAGFYAAKGEFLENNMLGGIGSRRGDPSLRRSPSSS